MSQCFMLFPLKSIMFKYANLLDLQDLLEPKPTPDGFEVLILPQIAQRASMAKKMGTMTRNLRQSGGT